MCMFWPSSHCPDVSNGGQWDHEGIVFLEAASLEKCRGGGLLMAVGVGGCSSFISPCSSGTWIDLRRDWSLQGFSVLALEHQDGFVSGFDLTVKDKHCWFGCMLQRYRRARKWARGTFIYCLIMLGGPGEASRELLPMIKECPAEKRGHPEAFLLIMQIHRPVSASLWCQFKAEAHRSPCV